MLHAKFIRLKIKDASYVHYVPVTWLLCTPEKVFSSILHILRILGKLHVWVIDLSSLQRCTANLSVLYKESRSVFLGAHGFPSCFFVLFCLFVFEAFFIRNSNLGGL